MILTIYYYGPVNYPQTMVNTLLTIGLIFIVIAIVLMILGFLGKVAWKIGKWLIMIFIILALASWISSYL